MVGDGRLAAMTQEVELKLALLPSQRQRLLRHPLLKQAVSCRRQDVANVYYDTPDLALHDRGIALRIRRQGGQWLQTVKCAGESAGGLSSRPEWEASYAGTFDFSSVSDRKVRRFLEAQGARLLPCFATDFKRTTWRFESAPEQAILMMLDQGTIQAGGRQALISEVELELDGGSVAQLFALAESLGQRVALVPERLSKAERGYRLADTVEEEPVQAVSVAISKAMAPTEAFRLVALNCLEHWLGNQSGVLLSDDPEFIHQMRVAVRRLRAALNVFAPCLPPCAHDVLPGLESFMEELGKARDIDVLATEILPPVLADFPEDHHLLAVVAAVEMARTSARKSVTAACRSVEYGSLLRSLLRLVHELEDMPKHLELTLTDFARVNLDDLHKRVQRRAAHTAADDPVALHRLRIAIKRLRYSLEFFAPLMRKASARELTRLLARQQEKLGTLNDWANMDRVLTLVGGRTKAFRSGVARVLEWHRPHHGAMSGKVARNIARLGRLPAIEMRKS